MFGTELGWASLRGWGGGERENDVAGSSGEMRLYGSEGRERKTYEHALVQPRDRTTVNDPCSFEG